MLFKKSLEAREQDANELLRQRTDLQQATQAAIQKRESLRPHAGDPRTFKDSNIAAFEAAAEGVKAAEAAEAAFRKQHPDLDDVVAELREEREQSDRQAARDEYYAKVKALRDAVFGSRLEELDRNVADAFEKIELQYPGLVRNCAFPVRALRPAVLYVADGSESRGMSLLDHFARQLIEAGYTDLIPEGFDHVQKWHTFETERGVTRLWPVVHV